MKREKINHGWKISKLWGNIATVPEIDRQTIICLTFMQSLET
jgi:hypothetical protein